MPKVLNARDRVGKTFKKDQVYVGRPTKWGNPYRVGVDGTREEVIEMYRNYLTSHISLMTSLHMLRGKDLVCWCAPLACHADVLLEFANKEEISDESPANYL